MGMIVDKTVKFECDRCLKTRTFATMPPTQRPVDWHRYTDEFTEIDPDGNAIAGHTKRFLLCDECAPVTIPQKMPDENAVEAAKKYQSFAETDFADVPLGILVEDIKRLAGAVLSMNPATGDD